MRHTGMAGLAVLVVASALAACTAPATTPASPAAAAPDAAPEAVARQDTCPARLAFAQRCTALVDAKAWQSPTGIQVQPGEGYCLQTAPGQVWVDWFRRHTAPHGDAGNWLMQRVDHWKRHPDSDWFALMAAVQPAAAGATPRHQDLSRAALLRPAQAGALVLYANDAVSPVGNPLWFYENNVGQVRVTVWRCDGACACPAVPAP
jgi:hypothetical protein